MIAGKVLKSSSNLGPDCSELALGVVEDLDGKCIGATADFGHQFRQHTGVYVSRSRGKITPVDEFIVPAAAGNTE